VFECCSGLVDLVVCDGGRRLVASESVEKDGEDSQRATDSGGVALPRRRSSSEHMAGHKVGLHLLSGQHCLDGADDLGRVRFRPRTKPIDHLTVRGDQKLLEVPLNVACRAVGIGNLGQLGV
jgi:hypothetical protein